MNSYEVMYIIKPDLEGDALEEAITKVNEVIEKEGGSVTMLKRMGRRRLAYLINDCTEGYYLLLNLLAAPAIVPALEHFFKVSEGYLRYLVIRLHEDSRKGKPGEMQKEPDGSAAGSDTVEGS